MVSVSIEPGVLTVKVPALVPPMVRDLQIAPAAEIVGWLVRLLSPIITSSADVGMAFVLQLEATAHPVPAVPVQLVCPKDTNTLKAIYARQIMKGRVLIFIGVGMNEQTLELSIHIYIAGRKIFGQKTTTIP
jgi:hypothetical protein